MSYQDPIYNQNSNSLRNKTVPVFRTSSDICVFESPAFNMVGTAKVEFSGDTTISCDVSGGAFIFVNIYSATTECYINDGQGGPCLSAVTWNTQIYHDDILVYNNNFYTSVSGESITNIQWSGSVVTAFDAMGYDYTFTGTTFEIDQIMSVNNFKLGLETDVGDNCVSVTAPSVPGCTPTYTPFCDLDFSGLTNNDQNVYEIEDEATIGLEFNFTSLDIDAINNTNTRFKYEIYKYDSRTNAFLQPSIYTSTSIGLNSLSATSAVTDTVLVSELNIDGDYLVKGYYEFDTCTEFGKLLDLSYSTEEVKIGTEYQIYDEATDYYFVAFKTSDTPIFFNNDSGVINFSSLNSNCKLLDGSGVYSMPGYQGSIAVTLNGLVLANGFDYAITSPTTGVNQIQLSGETFSGDVMCFIYTNSNSSNNLSVDTIDVDSPIISGATDTEGSSPLFYNTTTGMFELFAEYTPVNNNAILITINGVTLANNIDYYLSVSNPKRIILEGNVFMNDIINIYYNTNVDVSGDIFTDSVEINWSIENPPQTDDGEFTVELSVDNLFTNLTNSVKLNYIPTVTTYRALLGLIGNAGDSMYYRVRNDKKYVNINGFPIVSTKYSEIIKITMQTNLSKSY